MIAALKAFFAWSAVGFIVLMLACAWIGAMAIDKVKRWLGIGRD